jgi:hypothetical protein
MIEERCSPLACAACGKFNWCTSDVAMCVGVSDTGAQCLYRLWHGWVLEWLALLADGFIGGE